MSKFLKEALSGLSNLKRIKLKVDPKNAALSNFTQFDGYEGYILEENPEDDTVDVFITTDDPSEMQDGLIQTLPSCCIDVPGSLSILEKFKLALIAYFKTRQMMPTEMLQDLVLAKNISECKHCLEQLNSEDMLLVLTNFIDLIEEND